MTIEEAIEYFSTGTFVDFGNESQERAQEARNMAISALRAQQESEKNEPLTLEEMRSMIGQPVWCEDGSGNCCWCLVSSLYSKNGFVGAIDDSTGLWDGDYYGMTGSKKYGLHEIGWLAYRHPPKEAQNV